MQPGRLGVARIVGKFAPPVASQHPVDARQCHGFTQFGFNGRLGPGNDDHTALGGIDKNFVEHPTFEHQVSMRAITKLLFVLWHSLQTLDDAPKPGSHADLVVEARVLDEVLVNAATGGVVIIPRLKPAIEAKQGIKIMQIVAMTGLSYPTVQWICPAWLQWRA